MSKTLDRRVVIAVFAVFGLFLIGAGVGIYRVEAGKLDKVQADLRTDQTRLEDVKAKIAQLPKLQQDFAQLQSRISFLEPSLPTAEYIPTFLWQIERLAISTNNQIVLIRPKKAQKTASTKSAVKINNETGEAIKEGEGGDDKAKAAEKKTELPYDFVPIEMKVEGNYWTTLEFLKQLQRFPKMIAVNTIGFTPKTGTTEAATSNSTTLTVSMDLMAVVMKGAKDGKSK